MTKTRIVTFSMRIPESVLTCWLEHFFAVVDKVKDDNGNRSSN